MISEYIIAASSWRTRRETLVLSVHHRVIAWIGTWRWKLHLKIALENWKLHLKIENCTWKLKIALENWKLHLIIENCTWKLHKSPIGTFVWGHGGYALFMREDMGANSALCHAPSNWPSNCSNKSHLTVHPVRWPLPRCPPLISLPCCGVLFENRPALYFCN